VIVALTIDLILSFKVLCLNMCSREILRKTISPSQNPVLWASTYDAGEVLRKLNLFPSEQIENIVIRGFLAQSALIYSQIEAELSKSNEDKKILIVEGVHLSVENILRLKEAFGCCIPFIIFVSDKVYEHMSSFVFLFLI